MAKNMDIIQLMAKESRLGLIGSAKNGILSLIAQLKDRVRASGAETTKDLDSHIKDIRQQYTERKKGKTADGSFLGLETHELAKFFKEIAMLSPENLQKLSEEQIINVKDALGTMFGLLSSSGLTEEEFKAIDSIEELKDNQHVANFITMKKALDEALATIGKFETIQEFGKESLDSALADLSAGTTLSEGSAFAGIPTKDLDIVSALRMTGVDLQLVANPDDPSAGWKWVLPEDAAPNDFALVSKSESQGDMYLTFSRTEVQAFLDNYLNAPKESRQSISPDGVLKAFYQMMEKKISSLPDKTEAAIRATELFGRDSKQKYTAGSMEFSIVKLTDENQILRLAQAQVLKNFFVHCCGQVDMKDISDQFSQELHGLIDSAGLPADMVKSLTAMEGSFMEQTEEYASDNYLGEDATTGVVAQYDKMIESLETSGAEESAAKLRQARELLLANIDFQTQWIRDHIDLNNTSREELFYFSQDTVSMCHMEGGLGIGKDGEYVFKGGAPMSGDMANVLDFVNSRYQERKIAEQQKFGNPNAAVKDMANIYDSFENIIANESLGSDFTAGFMKDMTGTMLVEMASHLFKKGNLFDVEFHAMLEQSKPKDFNTVFAEFAERYGFFTKESLEEAYIENNPDSDLAKEIGKSVEQRKATRQAGFTKNLVILDIAASSLTPDEYNKYYDPATPQDVRDQIIQSKLKDAIKTVDKMSKEEYDKVAADAQRRHQNSLLHKMLSGNVMPELADFEKGLPEDKRSLTPTLKKYLDELVKNQNANNQLLAKDGKPIVGAAPAQKAAEQEAEEEKDASKKPDTKKFGALYPSSPNKEKFLKLMKPYHGKEIVKYFFEPLLASIDKLPVNMEAYRKRQQSTYTAHVQDMPQENKSAPKKVERQAGDNHPVDNMPEQEPKTNAATTQDSTPVKISQRDFEASTFLHALDLVSMTSKDISSKGLLYEPLGHLQKTLQFLASAEEHPEHPLCKGDKPERHFRDDLRQLVLDIASGSSFSASEDPTKDILAKIDSLADNFGLDKSDPLYESIKIAFTNMNPSLAVNLLKPCSDYDEKSRTLQVGSKLPVNSLAQCKTDKERLARVHLDIEGRIIDPRTYKDTGLNSNDILTALRFATFEREQSRLMYQRKSVQRTVQYQRTLEQLQNPQGEAPVQEDGMEM